jgi:hypothetical protein
MEEVWIDFGNGPQLHEERTKIEMLAFIDGVMFACEHLSIDDIRRYDTREDMEAAQEDERWIVRPEESAPITVVVEGGVVQEVLNLPPGKGWELQDHDIDTEDRT